jgi:hypothetical protein
MKNKINALIATLAAVGFVQVASAITIPFPNATGLLLFDSTGTGTTMTMGLDANGNASWNASVGSWNVVLTAGATINGGANPQIDLSVTHATATAGAGNLYIYFTSGLFGPSVGTWNLTSHEVSGTATTYAYMSTGFPFSSANLLGSTAIPGTVAGGLNSGGLQYYLAVEDIISATTGAVSLDSNLSVPDGGATVMLLGMALSGVALLRRKLAA